MSIEALLTSHTTELAKNTETMLALIAALKVTGENQERLIAGQAAAIEKVEPAKRTRVKKDETPAAATTTPAEPDKPAGRVISEDDLKTLAGGWLNEDPDKTVRTTRGEFLKAVLADIGSPKIAGPESTLDEIGRKKAWFFISRKKEGLQVDFSADYDFDGDVTAGGEPEPAEEDLGI